MPLPSLNIFEKLRGIYTDIIDIRRKVLTEVAKMVVEDKDPHFIEAIPYAIIEKNTPTYRDCVFRERAIVRERVRLAFGMDLKEFGAHGPIIDDVAPYLDDKKLINPPIVNVIKIGCERCPELSYYVSNICMGCIAHPCVAVCPKKAVSMVDGRSFIDQTLCIKCGRCAQVCPYNAIVFRERPCASACGVNAIHSDSEGFAEIDENKCVSCGLCIVSCPFGAIGEKSSIVQILIAMKKTPKVYAALAPSFVGQFGPLVKPEMMITALKQAGFAGLLEVAYGADMAIMAEGDELINSLNCDEPQSPLHCRQFIGTSCCPSWVMAARKKFPELARNISESYTPMVETAKKIKNNDPDAKVVFIGPCIAKKIEGFNPIVAQYVDYIMTFEELMAIFQAKNIDPTKIAELHEINDASPLGRGFPVAGGVASAIMNYIEQKTGQKPDVPFQTADTLTDCLNLLEQVQKGKISPLPKLIEGMACPNGCVGGPGTLAPLKRAKNDVAKFTKNAKKQLIEQ